MYIWWSFLTWWDFFESSSSAPQIKIEHVWDRATNVQLYYSKGIIFFSARTCSCTCIEFAQLKVFAAKNKHHNLRKRLRLRMKKHSSKKRVVSWVARHEFVEAKPQKVGLPLIHPKNIGTCTAERVSGSTLHHFRGLGKLASFIVDSHTSCFVFDMAPRGWKFDIVRLKIIEIWVDGKLPMCDPRLLADPQFVRSLQPWWRPPVPNPSLMLRLPCQTLGLHAHLWWCLLSCLLGKVSPRSNSLMSHTPSPSPHVCRERWTLNVAVK